MHKTAKLDASIDLVDAITILPRQQRRVVILYYFGLTQCEIGLELGITHQAVSKLLEKVEFTLWGLQNTPSNSS